MQPVSSAEIEALARRHGLQVDRVAKSSDAGGRQRVSWEIVWLKLPDDGTGALPLLRHVVFNDQKSSTYKLALLRALLRIADGAAGFARPGTSGDRVELPLGLVALYWIRSFQPLIKANLPQRSGGNHNLGFAKAGFRGLLDRSPFDLRVGQRFNERDAENLILAIREAAACIKHMPAHHIRYPRQRPTRLSMPSRRSGACETLGQYRRGFLVVIRFHHGARQSLAGHGPLRRLAGAGRIERMDSDDARL